VTVGGEKTMTKILVTGCLGFIGSHFVKYILKETDWEIVGFNRHSDQRNLWRLNGIVETEDRFHLIYGDLSKNSNVSGILEDVDYCVNFAAKTFVDHAIRDAFPFVESNILGTVNLLEEAKRNKPTLKRYLQVSTDEVYGAILKGSYVETSCLNPTNPYAAAKASADMMCVAYYHTYGTPILITRTENNFGEFQHPQKALPKFVKYAMEGRKLPVYGDGEHSRMWLYVEEHCSAIKHLLLKGEVGQIYHVAGEQELTNNQLAKIVLETLGKDTDLIEHIDDHNARPGHDRRYALDTKKIRATGWKPKYKLNDKLQDVIRWYATNDWWSK
jgi:dTDP-glucose 4,6-dehydratase